MNILININIKIFSHVVYIIWKITVFNIEVFEKHTEFFYRPYQSVMNAILPWLTH